MADKKLDESIVGSLQKQGKVGESLAQEFKDIIAGRKLTSEDIRCEANVFFADKLLQAKADDANVEVLSKIPKLSHAYSDRVFLSNVKKFVYPVITK